MLCRTLITQRSQVQILPPLQGETPLETSLRGRFAYRWEHIWERPPYSGSVVGGGASSNSATSDAALRSMPGVTCE